MDLRLLTRLKRLAQHPPSARAVKVGLVVLAFCLALVAIEAFFGWPEALTTDRARRPAIRPLP
jgi:hypothetical protein